ncbi:MAG: hypothetical protein R3E13_02120 [Alphaproteobacteria bacterium]
MAKLKNTVLKDGIKWHKWLGWTGGLALLLFAISGMTHPLMTWTGPKAASFFPPQAVMKADYAAAMPRILKQNGITKSIMVKVVPAEDGAVMQVTQHDDWPRRYFNLETGQELKGYDEQHAVWLARYYTGLKDAPVKEVSFQSEFDNAYPWVNRLLPVYRVVFDTPDNRTAFIYTELGALGNLTNNWKTGIQGIFRTLHTWSWLEGFEYARVFLMMVLLVSLFGMAATGTAMVFLMKSRKILDGNRKWHRFISYAVWVPLLAFSASGSYHLLQSAYGDNHRGLQLGEAISMTPDRFGGDASWLKLYNDVKLNGLSLVEGLDGNLLYRLSIPQGRPGQKVERAKRFDGVPIEKPALYFDARSGEESGITDKDMAIYYAGKHLGFNESQIKGTHLVTHFGPHYDFRNKRLPVWQIDYNSTKGDKLFIDPATGILVDRLTNLERYEGYSFSFLHKWNFLTPFIGRELRDVLIVLVLLTAIGGTVFGYIMLLKPKKKRL